MSCGQSLLLSAAVSTRLSVRFFRSIFRSLDTPIIFIGFDSQNSNIPAGVRSTSGIGLVSSGIGLGSARWQFDPSVRPSLVINGNCRPHWHTRMLQGK